MRHENQVYFDTPSLRTLNAQLIADAPSWQNIYTCPTCESCSVIRFATIRGIPHTRCETCGFTFVNPIPPPGVLHNLYNSAFYSNYRRLEARRIAKERYFSISMYTDMQRLAGWLGQDKSVSILDYGCGPASFIAYLRDKCGFGNVEGLEINRESVEIARINFDLRIASSCSELNRRAYDIVLLLEVIEHIPQPNIFLEEVAALVKPGGRLLITTPAVDNLLGRFLPWQCPHYTALIHVSLFTKRALTVLLNRFGFTVERFETDKSCQIAQQAVGSLFYKLDFASPKHDSDSSDLLYVPTPLGRLLGLQSSRQMSIAPRLARLDGFVVRATKCLPIPRNNHLYVLARKGGKTN